MKLLPKFINVPILLSLSLSIFGMAACSSPKLKPGETHETVPLVGSTQVHRFKLANGLKLLVVEDHSSPTFAYHTWYRVGSRDENVGNTGLAHLFEHMMFKETKNLKEGQFDKILESAGAEGENAFTSRDYTAYVQELPSDKLDLIAKLESDRMVNLVVDQKAFKTETDVVQNERRFRNENSPDGTMYQTLFELAYEKHPYHWPVIGYQEDLDRMSAKDAMEFYKRFYSPNHATIVITGDVDPNDALTTIQKYYGSLEAQPDAVQNITPEPKQQSPRRKQLKLNMQVEKLYLGYHIPEFGHADSPALAVLRAVMSGGKSSRLHRALVETGIASSVDAYDLEDKDPSLFIVAASLQKKKRAAQAEAVILREIARMAKDGPTAQEIERAKNRLNFEFYENLTNNSQRANFLGHYEAVTGSFEEGLAMRKKITEVTRAQVKEAANRYLEPKNRTVVTGAPK